MMRYGPSVLPARSRRRAKSCAGGRIAATPSTMVSSGRASAPAYRSKDSTSRRTLSSGQQRSRNSLRRSGGSSLASANSDSTLRQSSGVMASGGGGAGIQGTPEPGFPQGQIAFHSGERQTERLGNLIPSEAAEVAQFDDLAFSLVHRAEFFQCFINREQLLGAIQ